MRFSSRTPRLLDPNPLSEAAARLRASGAELLDLTESNPTRAGFRYPERELLEALADPRALAYEPDPRGRPPARRAVADYYAARGVEVDPDAVVLTASTSEAYTFLFKLLCEPGDEVLVPAPSYPLFEHLARVEAVAPVQYRLALDGRWRVDPDAVREALTPRSRAVVVVSPNNPTGSALTRAEVDALVEVCAERGLALVCDEVFADYLYAPDARLAASLAAEERVLTFTLNGLSKVAGLPQLKLGWVVTSGPAAARAEALARLEFVADLFLSVNAASQVALPSLFELSRGVREQILARVTANRAWLRERLSGGSACSALPADGGWSATLRVPRVCGEDRLALDLLERERVLLFPGYFFDYPLEGLLVASLLAEPGVFREGVTRAVAHVERLCGA